MRIENKSVETPKPVKLLRDIPIGMVFSGIVGVVYGGLPYYEHPPGTWLRIKTHVIRLEEPHALVNCGLGNSHPHTPIVDNYKAFPDAVLVLK